MPQITIKDALGNNQTVAATANTGQAPASESLPVVIASDQTGVTVVPSNITTKFRETFESLNPAKWTVTKASTDLVEIKGSALSASYATISKCPWTKGNESLLETVSTFAMPVDISFGIHRSQATLGQEFSIEFVDTGTPLADVPDIAISSITQTTTTLTVDTVGAHNLVPGKCFGVRDCSNQLVNYPALVVATITSPTQFTATAGPGGTIPSQTVTNPTGAKGFVFFRERLGRANEGVSQIFENATVTNSSFYVRSEQGDALPSGTAVGNHAVTVGTTASVQLTTSPYTNSFTSTTEYRHSIQADKVQFHDSLVDSITQSAHRVTRTQVVPNPDATYRFRIRGTNSKSLTTIDAKVISVTKTGTTTGTFITDRAHNLATGDLIVYYGNSNTAASAFPNLVTATAVTVLDGTTFTAVIGTASTVTGYGGIIGKVHGGNLPSAIGWNNNSAVNATLSTLSDGRRQLVLTGSGNWSGLVIGDLVNVEGVSNTTNGTLLGVDGVWEVANSVTTALTLVPATSTFAGTLGSDFTLTTCGGAVVKRTDLRVSFVRVFDYERERVEVLPRPAGDLSSAIGTVPQGGSVSATQSGTWNVATLTTLTGGGAAEDAAAGTSPVGVGGVVRTAAAPATLVAGDAARHTMTSAGALTVALGAPVAGLEVASAARTSTGNSGTISVPTGGAISGQISVTAVSGTNPVLDVTLEESYDNGTTWVLAWAARRITANTTVPVPQMAVSGLRRWVWTIAGTSPSFTFSISTNQLSTASPIIRNLIDRAIVSTTLNSASASLYIEGCAALSLAVVMGASGTQPVFGVQLSPDGTNWYDSGISLTTVASSTVGTSLSGFTAAFARVFVKTAGTGTTYTYSELRAIG